MSPLLGYGPAKVDVGIHVPAASRHARWADAGLSQANMYQPNDILTNACPVLPVPTVAGNQNFDFWVLHDTFLRSLSIKGNQQLESLCTAWVMVDLGNVARRMLTGGPYPALYKRLLCPRSNISLFRKPLEGGYMLAFW